MSTETTIEVAAAMATIIHVTVWMGIQFRRGKQPPRR